MRVGLVSWIVFLSAGVPLPAQTGAPHPTPEETRREFEAICRRLSDDNIYFGDANVRSLQQQLGGTAANTPREVELRGQLGWELVRLGRHQEAIEQLEAALARVEQPEDDRSRYLHGRISLTLAMAHLQLAEDQNCVERHTADSCILPFAEPALHTRPQHTRLAGDLLARHLIIHPTDLQARWLLNLSRMLSSDYPAAVPVADRLPPGALVDSTGFPPWPNIAAELGVDAFDLAGGTAVDDFDGDGLLDLISSSSDPCQPMKAYRNDGRGGFEDVATEWGLDGQLGGLNILHTDFDNDGALDVLVLRGAWLGDDGRIRNSLLRNDLAGPTGRFVDVTATAGLAYPAYPTQAAGWADYDGDGDLDLLIGNESSATSTDPLQFLGRAGSVFPSQLLRNNGDGTFTDVTRIAGVENQRFAKSVAWGDFDNDGDPDAYISNFGPNRLYRNNGDGTFTDVADMTGVSEPSRESFASWFFDVDNDGDLDLFVVDYSSPRERVSASYLGIDSAGGHPILYRNDGHLFQDVSSSFGLRRPLLPMGANFGDLDNDGWLDLYLGTGVPEFDALMPNVMYHNRDGSSFDDVTFSGGFGHLQKGHGVSFGDLDNDGDQDLYHQLGGAFPCDAFANALFENPGSSNRWLVLRLEGRQANRSALGARLEVQTRKGESLRSIHLVVGTGGSFGSSSLQQEVGLGDIDAIERVTILWPGSGLRQDFRAVEPDRFYRAREGKAELETIELPRFRLAARPRPAAEQVHHPQP